jgi:hypothetical protein
MVNENVTDNINTGNYLGRTDETETQKKIQHCKIHIHCSVCVSLAKELIIG